ncbi:MAG: hypothetical protein L6R38_004658 [Xanthoria sp. 2 TBL-2021]|nr:MAG: hypothetical protein L6R38_004658 [Xanthoria sp. 2 TBL-2021]
MATTLGSFALRDAKHSKQALVVQKVALCTQSDPANRLQWDSSWSKDSLSWEKPTYLGEKAVGGLSAVGGQCQSAYIKGGVIKGDSALGQSNPGGSSTGSAVGVAAGYFPLALGGEADGSINTPASRASLFALKCTPQTIPSDGIFLISPTFESPGGMAKTVEDLAGLIKIIVSTTDTPLHLPEKMPTAWAKFAPGFRKWSQATKQQSIQSEVLTAAFITQSHLSIPQTYNSKAIPEKEELTKATVGEIRESVNRTLEALPSTPVRSLADIIKFNNDHPDLQAGLDQTYHIQAQEDNIDQETLTRARQEMKRRAGEEGVDKMLSQFGLDAIIAPMDSPISTVAALAGEQPFTVLEPSGSKENKEETKSDFSL